MLADLRVARGEQYVAGGLALNLALGGARVSRDIDLFHDTDEALARSSDEDIAALVSAGYALVRGRQLVGYREVTVTSADGDAVEVQWVLLYHPGAIRGAVPVVRARTAG